MIAIVCPFSLVARAPQGRGLSLSLALTALAFHLFLGACAAPPNLQPLASATHQLAQAGRSLGPSVQRTLQAARLPEHANRFERAWSSRVKALEALSAYADNLRAIAQSAESEHERAVRYSDSLAALANVFAPAPGAGAIIAAAASAADVLSLQAARARANSSLAHACATAQPGVELLIDALREDLLDIDELVRTTHATALLQPQTFDDSQRIETAFAQALEGLASLREALRVWSELHAAAVKAITSNTEPDAREVEAAAARLRSLIQKAGGQ